MVYQELRALFRGELCWRPSPVVPWRSVQASPAALAGTWTHPLCEQSQKQAQQAPNSPDSASKSCFVCCTGSPARRSLRAERWAHIRALPRMRPIHPGRHAEAARAHDSVGPCSRNFRLVLLKPGIPQDQTRRVAPDAMPVSCCWLLTDCCDIFMTRHTRAWSSSTGSADDSWIGPTGTGFPLPSSIRIRILPRRILGKPTPVHHNAPPTQVHPVTSAISRGHARSNHGITKPH